jgi:hypothetical protein
VPFSAEGVNGKLFWLISAFCGPYSDDLEGLRGSFSEVLVHSALGEWRKFH